MTLSPKPTLIDDDAREAIAQAVHALYLEDRRQADDFGARPADRPWAEISEDDRAASRHHVDDVARQLQAVFLTVTSDASTEAVEPSSTQMEAMSELEHERWMAHKIADGWRYGPERDNAGKLTPMIVPWAQLDEPAREQDRVLVRQRPALMRRAGLRIVAVPVRARLIELLGGESADVVDQLALRLADAGLMAVAADGDGPVLEMAAVDRLAAAIHLRDGGGRWDDLAETDRQPLRVGVYLIEQLLRAVGYRIVPVAAGV